MASAGPRLRCDARGRLLQLGEATVVGSRAGDTVARGTQSEATTIG